MRFIYYMENTGGGFNSGGDHRSPKDIPDYIGMGESHFKKISEDNARLIKEVLEDKIAKNFPETLSRITPLESTINRLIHEALGGPKSLTESIRDQIQKTIRTPEHNIEKIISDAKKTTGMASHFVAYMVAYFLHEMSKTKKS